MARMRMFLWPSLCISISSNAFAKTIWISPKNISKNDTIALLDIAFKNQIAVKASCDEENAKRFNLTLSESDADSTTCMYSVVADNGKGSRGAWMISTDTNYFALHTNTKGRPFSICKDQIDSVKINIHRPNSTYYSDLGVYPRFGFDYQGDFTFHAGVILLGSKFESEGMGFWGLYSEGKIIGKENVIYGFTIGAEAGTSGQIANAIAFEYSILKDNGKYLHELTPKCGISLGYINLFYGYSWYFDENGDRQVISTHQFGIELNGNLFGLKEYFIEDRNE